MRSPTTPAKRPIIRSAAWCVLALTIVVVGAWSLPLYRELQVCRQQKAALREKVTQQNVLLGSLATFKDKTQPAIDDQKREDKLLLSMYGQCRSSDDFFVVHPHEFTAAISERMIDGFSVLLYVPEDGFDLLVGTKSEWRDANNDVVEKRPNTEQKFALQGGKPYKLDVVIDVSDKQQAVIRIDMNDGRKFVRSLGPSRVVGRSSPGNSGLQRTFDQWSMFSAKNEDSDDQLYVYDCAANLVHQELKHQGNTKIRLEIQTRAERNSKRYSAADSALMRQLVSARLNDLDLEYRDGWYYEKAK